MIVKSKVLAELVLKSLWIISSRRIANPKASLSFAGR